MKPGNFHLHACPFFWTWVGAFVRQLNFQELVIAHAMYFTRPGATFDVLCARGLVAADGDKMKQSLYHPLTVPLEPDDGTVVPGGAIIPAQGPKLPWRARTPWVKS